VDGREVAGVFGVGAAAVRSVAAPSSVRLRAASAVNKTTTASNLVGMNRHPP
jgi:hypothetical protein